MFTDNSIMEQVNDIIDNYENITEIIVELLYIPDIEQKIGTFLKIVQHAGGFLMIEPPPMGYEDTTDHAVSVLITEDFKKNVGIIIENLWIHGLVVRTNILEEIYLKQGQKIVKE